MRTVLVTLIGPERTTDLVVDADTPVAELLPSLLNAGGVSPSAGELENWRVALTGKQPLERDQTLEQSGVLDGAVLVIRREAHAPHERVATIASGAEQAGSPLARADAAGGCRLTGATPRAGAPAIARLHAADRRTPRVRARR